MASEPIDAQIVAELVRPELWCCVWHDGKRWVNGLARPSREECERYVGPLPATFRLPGSAPAPAPDRRDELLREARWIIENTWTEFGVDRTSHQVKPRLDAFLAATAPAPAGEGAGR